MEEEEEVLKDEDITNIDYEEENPNKRFKKLTWMFATIFIIGLLAYGIYLKQDTIKGWFASEPEPERSPEIVSPTANVSDPTLILTNQMISMMPLMIIVVVVLSFLGMLLPIFRRLGGF